MRAISIQVQPARVAGIDMTAVQALLEAVARRQDLVDHYHFDNGEDGAAYLNFTFGTSAPSLLWAHIWASLY
jgi:hypothetical protein